MLQRGLGRRLNGADGVGEIEQVHGGLHHSRLGDDSQSVGYVITVSSDIGVTRRIRAHSLNRATASSGVRFGVGVDHSVADQLAAAARPPLPCLGQDSSRVVAVEPHDAT